MKKNRHSKKLLFVHLLFFLVFAIIFSLYAHYQNTELSVSYYHAESEEIPESFDRFLIAQVSDFHNVKTEKLQNAVLSEITSAKPDIIVITGDLIDSRRTDIPVSLAFCEKLTEIAEIYYIPGNHEAATRSYRELEAGLISMGINVLRNSHKTISIGNDEINILGIDDPLFTDNDDKYEVTQLNLDKISYNEENFTVLLAHRPEIFSVYKENKIDLVFSGHAHGGQFVIPYLGGLFTPTEGFFPEYTEGFHTEDGSSMAVSRGIGNSKFPIRLNNPPELVFVTLHSK